jgi:hypothetical protein
VDQGVRGLRDARADAPAGPAITFSGPSMPSTSQGEVHSPGAAQKGVDADVAEQRHARRVGGLAGGSDPPPDSARGNPHLASLACSATGRSGPRPSSYSASSMLTPTTPAASTARIVSATASMAR